MEQENTDSENGDEVHPPEEESELGDLGIEEDDDGIDSVEQEEESDDYSDIDSGNEDDADVTSLDTIEGSPKQKLPPMKEENKEVSADSKCEKSGTKLLCF